MSDIDPLNLAAKSNALLAAFLEAQFKGNLRYWKKAEKYQFNGEEITLRHDIVWTEKKERNQIDPKNNTALRFRIIDKKLAEGGFGGIFDVIGTLKLQPETGKLSYKQSKRVVKIESLRRTGLHYKEESDIQHEYKMTAKAGHLGVKKPTFVEDTAFMVMDKVPGINLLELLKIPNAMNFANKKALTLNLLKALKDQVIDKKIYHGDLNPQNIMVDTTDYSVKIIDYGLANKYKNLIVYGVDGVQLTDEAILKEATQKYDIPDISSALGRLWANYEGVQPILTEMNERWFNNRYTIAQAIAAFREAFEKDKLTLKLVPNRKNIIHLAKKLDLECKSKLLTISVKNLLDELKHYSLNPNQKQLIVNSIFASLQNLNPKTCLDYISLIPNKSQPLKGASLIFAGVLILVGSFFADVFDNKLAFNLAQEGLKYISLGSSLCEGIKAKFDTVECNIEKTKAFKQALLKNKAPEPSTEDHRIGIEVHQ